MDMAPQISVSTPRSFIRVHRRARSSPSRLRLIRSEFSASVSTIMSRVAVSNTGEILSPQTGIATFMPLPHTLAGRGAVHLMISGSHPVALYVRLSGRLIVAPGIRPYRVFDLTLDPHHYSDPGGLKDFKCLWTAVSCEHYSRIVS